MSKLTHWWHRFINWLWVSAVPTAVVIAQDIIWVLQQSQNTPPAPAPAPTEKPYQLPELQNYHHTIMPPPSEHHTTAMVTPLTEIPK